MDTHEKKSGIIKNKIKKLWKTYKRPEELWIKSTWEYGQEVCLQLLYIFFASQFLHLTKQGQMAS